jgi:glutaredoxin
MAASGGTDAKVRGPAAWLFTYAQTDGTFATTDDAEAVPAAARSVVRVVDLAPKAAPSEAAQGVYVMDLKQYLKFGRTTAKPVSRQAFETAAIAQLPPGESSAWASPAGSPGQEEAAAGATVPGASSPTAASAEAPVVTVYGTSWCGACKAARQYLAKRKVPFADKDIEKDPAAAAELQRKAARLGVPADRVPILDVRGRLLVGFDRARLEALLGEPS